MVVSIIPTRRIISSQQLLKLVYTRLVFNGFTTDYFSTPFTCLSFFEKKFEIRIKSEKESRPNPQARVAQLVARRLAVPEIRVQTPPGAN